MTDATINKETPEPLWLDYFTEGVEQLHIQPGMKPYTRSIVPLYTEPVLLPLSIRHPNTLISSPSNEIISESKFFYEISQFLTTEEHWRKFFSSEGVSFSHRSSTGGRYRAHATCSRGTATSATLIIRRLPTIGEIFGTNNPNS